MKAFFKIFITCILIVACFSLSGCVACTPFDPANDEKYNPENCQARQTALTGKTVYWLGSSVTLGMASMEVAVADYIAARNGATCVKDAVSGTTLIDSGKDSYVSRLVGGNKFDKTAKVDAFVVQVSTNDAKSSYSAQWGAVSAADKLSGTDFDKNTTVGAMEYIISYIRDTWNCPIYLYTNAYFGSEGVRSISDPKGSDYAAIIENMKKVAEKWTNAGVKVSAIDLYNDAEFNNSITDEQFDYYMYDAVHPYKAGYLEWWTPAIEKALINGFSE